MEKPEALSLEKKSMSRKRPLLMKDPALMTSLLGQQTRLRQQARSLARWWFQFASAVRMTCWLTPLMIFIPSTSSNDDDNMSHTGRRAGRWWQFVLVLCWKQQKGWRKGGEKKKKRGEKRKKDWEDEVLTLQCCSHANSVMLACSF